MEFDFTGFLEIVAKALKILFGGQIPGYISNALALCVILLAFLIVAYASLWLFINIIDLLNDKLKPYFYDTSKKRRQNRRQRFAEHIRSEIIRLNNQESWEDYRFTELEAEIEAQGKYRQPLPFLASRESLSREKSLSHALKKTTEKLILLEGEPGSGKSVALRHLTLKLAKKASDSKNLKTIIPLYINLKGLARRNGEPIDQNLIRAYIYKTLNRVNSRDVETFLEDEFGQGIEDGTWLFLFDSFDEIPEVLSSVEADKKIQNYAEAIRDFLSVFSQCRGIISSREYRGPRVLNISKFRILPLSEFRQKQLIKNIDLDGLEADRVIGELGNSSYGFKAMSGNPMFLALLCEYIHKSKEFPQNSHLVYKEYLNNRLERDAERLHRRFKLTLDEVKRAAKYLAYCMTAEQNLGLTPTRDDLKKAAEHHNLDLGTRFSDLLDALEFLKIARSEGEAIQEKEKTFTFAHRRFQEYFATLVALNMLAQVSSTELLTNGKWRETTVVLLQTQKAEHLSDLIRSATEFIEVAVQELNCSGYSQDADFLPENFNETLKRCIEWPNKLLHILGILQEGLLGHTNAIPVNLQNKIDDILSFIVIKGTLLDRKLSLEVSGSASQNIQKKILKLSFLINSSWINNIAYTQLSYLKDIDSFFKECIRLSLLRQAYSGQLYQNIRSSKTYLQRINRNKELLSAFVLLKNIPLLTDFSKLVGLVLLLSLRRTVFLLFLNSHQSYKLFFDALLLILSLDIFLDVLNWAVRHENKQRSLINRFNTFYLCLASVIILSFPVWLFWVLDSNSSNGSNLIIPSFLFSHLDNFFSDGLTDFGGFLGVISTFLSILFLGSFWKTIALRNYLSGIFLEWYWWPLYHIVYSFKTLFKFTNNFSREILSILGCFIETVRLVFRDVVALFRLAVRQGLKGWIRIILVALFLVFWRIWLPFILSISVLYFVFSVSIHIFTLCASWIVRLCFMAVANNHINRISRQRKRKLFNKVSQNNEFSLALISEALKTRQILDEKSFIELINEIEKRLDHTEISNCDIDYLKTLALSIENYRDMSEDTTKRNSEARYMRFAKEYLRRNTTLWILYHCFLKITDIIQKIDSFLDLGTSRSKENLVEWGKIAFKFKDIRRLKTFTGSVEVNLLNDRFSFLRNYYLMERIYMLVEKAEKVNNIHPV